MGALLADQEAARSGASLNLADQVVERTSGGYSLQRRDRHPLFDPAIVATLPDGVDVPPGTVVSVRPDQTDVDAGTVSFALV